MKSARRIGCWTVAALIVALGTLVVLFSPFNQERGGNVNFFAADVAVEEDERIKGNLLLVGEDLLLKGRVDGNVLVIGGNAVLAATSRVDGNVSVVGGDVDVTGDSRVGGNLAAVGGDASLSGTSRVSGNISVVGGRVERHSGTQVGGNVNSRVYTVPAVPAGLGNESEIQVQIASQRAAAQKTVADAQSQIAGVQAQVVSQRAAAEWAAAEALAQAASHRPPWFIVFLGRLVQAFLWTLLITGLVLLVVWLRPKHIERITQTAESETGLSFAVGAIVVMGSALLAAILTITICFALLALPLLAVLALVMLFGWAVTCCWLGRRLDEFLASQAKLTWPPLISVAACSLFITGITTFSWALVACLGFVVALLIGSTGSGAVLVHLARRSGRRSNVHGAGPDALRPADGLAPPAAEAPASASPAVPDTLAETSEPPAGERLEADLAADLPATEEEQSPPESAPPDDLSAPEKQDDFTRLSGIGPTFARSLQNAGIATFAQLAALEVEQAAAAVGWSATRVERERLRERAAELAAGK